MESQLLISDKSLCLCGCGECVRLSGQRFIHGHHRRGLVCSPEHKAKLSMANKGRTMSPEQRRVNSEVHLGLVSGMKGKHHSDETKRKLSDALRGRHIPEEIRRKIRESYTDERREKLSLIYMGRPSPMKGKHHSEETKKRLSLIHKGRIISEESRRKMSLSRMGHIVLDETRAKLRAKFLGKTSPMLGRKHSNETKMKMRVSAIKIISTQMFDGMPVVPRIGSSELEILNGLQDVSSYPILRQYQIRGYFLDGYIPEHNIAIEIDEEKHKRMAVRVRDAMRQSEIEEELGCVFFRITPLQWREKNRVLDEFLSLLENRVAI